MTTFELEVNITETRKVVIEADTEDEAKTSFENNFPEICSDSEYVMYSLSYDIINIKHMEPW